MHTFAKKPNVRRPAPAGSTIFGQKRAGQAQIATHHATRADASQRQTGANIAAAEVETAAARPDWNFSRIPVHAAASAGLQTKLKLGTPGDVHEQEADRIADQVMRMEEPAVQFRAPADTSGHRMTPAARVQAKSTRAGDNGAAVAPPVVDEVLRSPGRPLDTATRTFMERRLLSDLSGVRVHADAQAAQASDALDARAFTVGNHVAFGAGQYAPGTRQGKSLIAHELVHTMQQAPFAGTAFGGESGLSVQRKVRVDNGAKRVKKSVYQKGGAKQSVGSKFKVSRLIADSVRRAFVDVPELEAYADGALDHIGDVATKAGTFWFRLPKDKLTVLGEYHNYANGNVEDVITGLNTSRFKYEPMNEMASLAALNIPFTGTQTRLDQVNKNYPSSAKADRKKFNPDLENIILKALTGAAQTRAFISNNPPKMKGKDREYWGSRPTTGDYSMGERVALYLAFGMHIASDIAQHNFGPRNFVETPFITSARNLKGFYIKQKAVLDKFMLTKDGNQLIGIFELVEPGGFKDMPVILDFCLILHEFATRYIEQLGAERGNKELETQGQALRGNPAPSLDDMSPAREEIMWDKVLEAKAAGFLLVGMGDQHRKNLTPKLDKAGIDHMRVDEALVKQRADVRGKWAR